MATFTVERSPDRLVIAGHHGGRRTAAHADAVRRAADLHHQLTRLGRAQNHGGEISQNCGSIFSGKISRFFVTQKKRNGGLLWVMNGINGDDHLSFMVT